MSRELLCKSSDGVVSSDQPCEMSGQVVLVLDRVVKQQWKVGTFRKLRTRQRRSYNPALGHAVGCRSNAPRFRRQSCGGARKMLTFAVALLDMRVRPDALHQLVLAHEFSGSFHKRDQRVERPASETERLLAFQQHALARKKPKGAKDDSLLSRGQSSYPCSSHPAAP